MRISVSRRRSALERVRFGSRLAIDQRSQGCDAAAIAVTGEEGRELGGDAAVLGVGFGDELLELVCVEPAREIEDRAGRGGARDVVDLADLAWAEAR